MKAKELKRNLTEKFSQIQMENVLLLSGISQPYLIKIGMCIESETRLHTNEKGKFD